MNQDDRGERWRLSMYSTIVKDKTEKKTKKAGSDEGLSWTREIRAVRREEKPKNKQNSMF